MGKLLSRPDEILMLTILRLGENAYGVPIAQDVQQRTGKKVTLGSLWVSLDNLSKRGLLQKRMAEKEPEYCAHGLSTAARVSKCCPGWRN